MLQSGARQSSIGEFIATPHDERAAQYQKAYPSPEEVISFRMDGGVLRADYPVAFTLTSPPMVTCFPKLTKAELEKDQERGINRTDYELDLTMQGAKQAQGAFKDWCDKLDDLLLDYMYANQHLIGKKGYTKDQIAVMQKRSFKARQNLKTNKTYPDAMVCRTKGYREYPRLPVYDQVSAIYPLDVIGGDIVSVVLQYNGAYAKPNTFFGNSWQLIGVQRLGHSEKSDTVDAKQCFRDWNEGTFPSS
jgi:hypothetical protein